MLFFLANQAACLHLGLCSPLFYRYLLSPYNDYVGPQGSIISRQNAESLSSWSLSSGGLNRGSSASHSHVTEEEHFSHNSILGEGNSSYEGPEVGASGACSGSTDKV